MERDEYERMHAVEDRMWWYRGLRTLTADLLTRALGRSMGAGPVLDAGCGTGGMLARLAGRRHTVLTGVAVRLGTRAGSALSSSDVTFGPLSAEEIRDAIDRLDRERPRERGSALADAVGQRMEPDDATQRGQEARERQAAIGAFTDLVRTLTIEAPDLDAAGLVAALRARADDERREVALLRADPDPEPDDLAALAAAWIEQEVTFGPGAARDNCPVDRMAERLRVATETNPGVRP